MTPTTTATMRGAVFHGRTDLRVERVARPQAAPDELLLRVSAVGICGTDSGEFAKGPTMFPIACRHRITGHLGPMIPGHEFSGTVVGYGDEVAGFAVGDVVASVGAYSCGTCRMCLAGRTNLCASYATVGLHRDGALAEYVAVPARACARIAPYGLTRDHAALAQPMSIAVHVMHRGAPVAGERAIVVGSGGIGAFLVFALAQHGTAVTAIDTSPERLTIATRLGARSVARAGEALEAAPVVFEVSGSQAGFDAALSAVTSGGRLVTVGLPAARLSVDVRDATLREIEIVGTNAMIAATDLPLALGLLARDRTVWSAVAPRAIPLERVVADGFEPMLAGSARSIKTLIDPSIATSRATSFEG